MKLLLRWTLVLFALAAAMPALRAEVFPLDMGRIGHQAGQMDISRDASFQTILVTISIGDKQEYLINLPETAVYYLRVRHQQKVIWQEAVFALVEAVPDGRMPRLDWDAVPNALRYRLWLCRNQIRTQWLETPERAAHLNRVGAPWLVRMRGINAVGSLMPVTQMQLQWVETRSSLESKKPENPVVKKEPELHLDPNARDDDQAVYEPEDKDLLAGADESPMDAFIARVAPPNLPPLKRKHQVYAWLRYLHEKFEIDKKDRFESDPSSGFGTGASGQYFIQPNLSVTALVDTHATKTDYEAGGSLTPSSVQKRYRIYGGLGLDLLNTNMRMTDWSLNLGPVIGLVQVPLQQNEQKFTDYGIKLDGQHYRTQTSLTFLFLKSGSRELDFRWIIPYATIWSIKPFIGLYHYDTRQTAGAVTGLFHENGLRLGLERDF